MEYAITATAPGYGNGAYEARILKLVANSGNYSTSWDTATLDQTGSGAGVAFANGNC